MQVACDRAVLSTRAAGLYFVYVLFSERERDSRSRSLYAVPRPFVVCLSVCNVRASYSAGWNFPQFFTPFGNWPSVDIRRKFYWDRPRRTPPSGELNARGVAQYSDFRPIEGYISETVQDGGKLVLITNRKSYMSFRLVPKSVTLNDFEGRNCPYIALFHRIR